MTGTHYLKITEEQISNVFCTLISDMQEIVAKPSEIRFDHLFARIEAAKFDLFSICNQNAEVQSAQEIVKPSTGRMSTEKMPIPTFGGKK